RTEYLRQQGISYNEMEQRGIMLPLTETHCKYLQGAKYDDMVIVRTYMTRFSGARITMEYDVIRESDNCLLDQGKTVHAITDNNLKPINIRKVDPKLYELFLRCVNKD